MLQVRSVVLSLVVTSICGPSSMLAEPPVTGLRLASPQEGEAIVQAAWELRHGLVPKPDCSHFVHAVYTQAGFLYNFAASRAMFAGIEGFRRVSKPQSGDVIVWQGHIGIVVDPKQHSFYSSVTAGFAIQSYRSRYWTGRGIPRFYRFLVHDGLSPAPLLGNLALRTSPPTQVLSSLTQYFPAQPPVLTRSDKLQMSAQSNIRKSASRKPVQVRPGQLEEERSMRPVMEDLPVKVEASGVGKNNTQMKGEVLVTSNPKPAKKEVLAAVRGSVDANAERLMQSGSLESQPSVSVVDHVKIRAINLRGTSGVADLEFKQMATFEYGKAIPARMTARRHVNLSRQEQGWVLVMPQDLMCLNRDLAFMALADQLANEQSMPANSREARLSRRLLSDLMSERKFWRPRTWFRLSRSSGKVPSSPEAETEKSAGMPRTAQPAASAVW